MNKLMTIAMTAALTFGVSISMASEGDHDHHHTADYCSVKDANVCAHLGHMENLLTDQGQFVIDVSKSLGKLAHTMSVVIHSPVIGEDGIYSFRPTKLEEFNPNHFLVSETQFPMAGVWTIELNFSIDTEVYQINIPLDVK